MKKPIYLAIFISSFFFLSHSIAGTFSYRSLVPGERASGMGGAFIALSNSAEGGYYNPAGLAFLDFDTISVSGNYYTFTKGERENAIVFAGSREDLPQDSFTSIPQIASFAKRFQFPWEEKEEDQPYSNAAALNVVVTEQTEISGRVNFSSSAGQAIGKRSVSDLSLMVGPSYARRINDRLSFGATLFYALRIQDGTAFLLNDSSTQFVQAYLSDESTVGNLVGLLGARYSPYDDFWIGLTYQPKSLRIHSSGSRLLSAAVTNRTTDELTETLQDKKELSPKNESPHTFGLGLAYEGFERLTLAADLLVHLENSYNSLSDGTGANINQDLVFNFSVGGEYFFTSIFALRAGMFSDFSSAPDVQQGVLGQPDQVNHYGWTLAGAIERENTSVSLGTMIRLGDGKGIDTVGDKINVKSQSYSILLAGSYRF